MPPSSGSIVIVACGRIGSSIPRAAQVQAAAAGPDTAADGPGPLYEALLDAVGPALLVVLDTQQAARVLTAAEHITDPTWAAAHNRMAALSTNSSHRAADATHVGLLDEAHGADLSARAIDDVLVLTSGLGAFSANWARIEPALAGTTRVCRYDRAGQGWSDDAPHPQDGLAAAEDLHTLLGRAGEDGPYVLVGHSIGGDCAMTYAARYPEQVAGMFCSTPRPHTGPPAPRPPTPARPARWRCCPASPAWASGGCCRPRSGL